jgi:hypothetical protein
MNLFQIKTILFLFVIISNSTAQKAYKINVIHLYSFHSFNDFCQKGIVDMGNRKKINQKKVPNALFNYGVKKKYVKGLNKVILSSQIDSLVERMKPDNEIVRAIDRSEQGYPLGTFLILIEDKERQIITILKVSSIEKLMYIFDLYVNQFKTNEEKEFVSKHITPWLLLGYKHDLENLDSKTNK